MRVLNEFIRQSCFRKILLMPTFQKEPTLVLEVIHVHDNKARKCCVGDACLHIIPLLPCFIILLMVVAFLALGSNLGERESYLKQAIQDLQQYDIRFQGCSSIFETEPRDVLDQPWFLNAVGEVTTSLAPTALLDACLAVERRHHRVRTVAKSARTLDIDILFYGNRMVHEPGLTIPHPRFSQRKFVLVPLDEIAPGFIDPVSGKSIHNLLAEVRDASQVRRYGSPPA
jgi:2-amino-4-hydroxy-6-hydroxymethyldihydropteridine diphosphokinase